MSTSHPQNNELRTARWAGLWYLLLAISGLFGFMIFHPQLFVVDDPRQTFANFSELSSVATMRLFFEFAIVMSQALAAVWFYKLFKPVNEWAAWTLGIWGMTNAVAIMFSAIAIASGIDIAQSTALSDEQKVLLFEMISRLVANAWGVGSLFFGLWLIPLGHIVTSSARMPVWLGRTLVVGGIGYLLSVVANYAGVTGVLLDVLVIPATVGEFWMIGYLLIFGIRPMKLEQAQPAT